MNKIILIIVLLVIVAGGYFVFSDRGTAPTDTVNEEETNTPVTQNPTTTPSTGTSTPNSTVKNFTVEAVAYSFTPKNITVNQGDTVRITVKNGQGTHDLKIDEFNASTKILSSGQEETITFVANQSGSFEYYCSVGNHRAMGMVGTLTVVAR